MTTFLSTADDALIAEYDNEDDEEMYNNYYKDTKYQLLDEAIIPTNFNAQKEVRECRVCSDRSDGAHFGIDSCRACAAFFRRSVVMSKTYVCRQGGNNCVINKSVRCMCRKCRMRKCLEAGMLPENVQNRRDPIIPRRQDENNFHQIASSSATDMAITSPSPSENESARNLFVNTPSVNFPSYPPLKCNVDEPSLLIKIRDGYRNLCAVRRGIELSMNPESIKDFFSQEMDSEKFTPATTRKCTQFYRKHMPSISGFVMDTFDDFRSLEGDDKRNIFHAFLPNLWTIDGAYRTYKLYSENRIDNFSKYMITETTYIDLENLDLFLADAPTTKTSKSNLVSMMKQSLNGPKLKALIYMKEISITEEELGAVIALLLWNPNIDNCSPEVSNFIRECRGKVFQQLHLLYKYNKLDNYAERIGDIMCLFTCVLHQTTRMREDMELFNIFDVFAEDSFIYNIIRQ
ncbi:unnamed protein product [Auanema sp. JU1783]|nr:unnamed protein product [Auanema sp. JU1783]